MGLCGRVEELGSDTMWATQCDSSQAASIPWQQGAECVIALLAALTGYPKVLASLRPLLRFGEVCYPATDKKHYATIASCHTVSMCAGHGLCTIWSLRF